MKHLLQKLISLNKLKHSNFYKLKIMEELTKLENKHQSTGLTFMEKIRRWKLNNELNKLNNNI